MNEFAGSLKIDTRLDAQGFNKGIVAIRRSLKALAGVIGITFGIGAIVKFADAAINAASDIDEVQNVVDVAFGNMTNQVEEFSKTAIDQFGMSELAAKRTASTYMAMSKGMGIVGQAAADMAIDVAGLTGDVASFFNVRQEVADTALKSIFTGETESLKQFGVVMTEVNLQEFAYSKGIKKSISAMNQAEKTMLRYQFVTSTLSLAQGDFSRTSDSWANQTRILSERFKVLLGILGKGLIQILTPVVQLLNVLVSRLVTVANLFNQFVSGIFGKQAQEQKQVASAANAAAGAEADLAKATKEAGKAAKGSLSSFDELNSIQQESADAGSNLSDTLGLGDIPVGGPLEIGSEVEVSPVIQGAIDKIKELLLPLQQINFGNLKKSFAGLVEALKPFGKALFAGLEWAYHNILVPLATWVIEDALPLFLDLLSAAFGVLTSVIEVLKPFGIWLWDNFLKPLGMWTGGMIVTVIQLLAKALSLISSWIDTHGEVVRLTIAAIAIAFGLWEGINFLNYVAYIGAITKTTGWTALLNAVKQIVFLGFEPLKTAIVTASGTMKALLLSMADIVKRAAIVTLELGKQAASLVVSTFNWIAHNVALVAANVAQIAMNVATGIWNGLAAIATAVTAAFGVAVAFLASPIGLVVLAIGALIAIVVLLIKHWDTVKETAINVWNSIVECWKEVSLWFMTTVVEPLQAMFSEMWESIKRFAAEAWQGVVNTWKGASKWIDDKVITPISQGFKNFINGLISGFEGFVNGAIRGINAIIQALNKISFNVPSWVPIIGGNKWGFNLGTMSEIKIPRLATGAVIPPNNPFLAMLGDQKRGTNIEAPLETIVEAVKQALNEDGGGQGKEITVENVLVLDGEVIYRNQKKVKASQGYDLGFTG